MVQKLRLLVCLVVAATMAHGAHGATPEDAKAMAEKAALYLSENGEDKAFAAINDPVGPFRRGDLYVFVHDTTQNPETKALSPKTVYVIHVADFLICAGAYK